jgi:hypothetical protein
MLILGGMDKITQTLAQQMRIRILKSVPLLAMLTDEELIQVCVGGYCYIMGSPGVGMGQLGTRRASLYGVSDVREEKASQKVTMPHIWSPC